MAPRSDVADAAGVPQLDDALALLHFAFRTVTARADAALERRGMGRIHHRILYFVRRRSGLSVGELLGTLAITKQSLHRPLLTLTNAGYVTSSRMPTNRRTRELALTRKGEALERSLSGPQRALFAKVFAAHSPKQVASWRDVMLELGARQAERSF